VGETRRRLLAGATLGLAGCGGRAGEEPGVIARLFSLPGLATIATPRRGVIEQTGLRYREGPRGLLDLTLPVQPGPDTPLLVFFHGGGWRGGSRGEYVWLARSLAQEGIAVAIPDYGLWPQARWPDFVEDAAAAVAWLARGSVAPTARGSVAPTARVFVMGHSAGGFLAAALALDPRWLEAAGMPGGRGALAGAVLLAAPIDWLPEDEPNRSIFAAAPGGRIAAAPDTATLPGTPPLLLVHGAADTIVGPFHSERLARAVPAAQLLLMEGGGHLAPIVALAAPARGLGIASDAVWEAVPRFVRAGRG